MNARNDEGEENGEPILILADVMDGLDQIENSSIQLVLTSPPYNLGKVYESDSTMNLDEYVDWLNPVIQKLCTKLDPNGSVCWQVGNYVRHGEVFPLDYFFYRMFQSQGLKLRNRIIWRFNFGLNASKRLSGRYETLLWFSKSDNYRFNLNSIRVPQLYPGKRHSSGKGTEKAGKPSGNPLGKNPSDFWEFSAQSCFIDNPVWEFPNVKASHPERTIHPCQFPHELAERCILGFTDPGGTVLDPFSGSGTTAIAATKAGRRAIAIDRSAEYMEVTRERLQALSNGTLSLRKSGTAVLAPRPSERVAQVPIEWRRGAK